MLNWAELKYGQRLRKLANEARERVRARRDDEDPDEKTQRFKLHVWHTLTDASYSKLAGLTVSGIGMCIFLSTVCFIVETLPSFEQSDFWSDTFFYAEIFFVAAFSLEFVVRFWSTPDSTRKFLRDPFNIIDILSILPFYIEMVLTLFVAAGLIDLDLRILRAFRLMRMMKMGRFSSDLQLLAEGLQRSTQSLMLLCATLILGIIFYATIMWIVELGTWDSDAQCYARHHEANFDGCSPFQSVPHGFWWGIVTMSTVGYGDTFPLTVPGRVIAGLAMVSGIFCLAIPTGLLCEDFANLHKEKQLEGRQGALSYNTQKRKKHQIELHLNSVRLQELTKEMDNKLMHLKHLRMAYADHPDNPDDETQVDTFFPTFHGQAIDGMNNLVLVIHSMTDDLRVR